jgi:hypothetical protein
MRRADLIRRAREASLPIRWMEGRMVITRGDTTVVMSETWIRRVPIEHGKALTIDQAARLLQLDDSSGYRTV